MDLKSSKRFMYPVAFAACTRVLYGGGPPRNPLVSLFLSRICSIMYNTNIYITPCTCRLWLAPGPLACIITKVCVCCVLTLAHKLFPPSPTKNACMKLYGVAECEVA